MGESSTVYTFFVSIYVLYSIAKGPHGALFFKKIKTYFLRNHQLFRRLKDRISFVDVLYRQINASVSMDVRSSDTGAQFDLVDYRVTVCSNISSASHSISITHAKFKCL